MKELVKFQTELDVPKGQHNDFGDYDYRSLEDITEAVKPLLKKYNCTLKMSDKIVMIGERYYVEATVTLTNASGECETTQAYARESLERKKSDGSQLTGAASSYARKYALGGLFCLDDTKDADTNEYKRQNGESPRDALIAYCRRNDIDMNKVAAKYELKEGCSDAEYEHALAELQDSKKSAAKKGSKKNG